MSDVSLILQGSPGFISQVDLSTNQLVVGTIKVGGAGGSVLSQAILDNLINLQNGTDFSNGTNSHTHDGRYYTKTQLDGGQLNTLYYTKSQLNAATGSGLIGYDNTGSGLSATLVQSALDEIVGRVQSLETAAGGYALTDLSNLVSPTAVNQDLLGATGFSWFIKTQDSPSSSTRDIYIKSGDSALVDSGDVILQTGSAALVRGQIRFVNGTEGTAGYVWTSTDVDGRGSWMPPGGGGAAWFNYPLSYVDFQTAALTNDIELFSLPAKGVIHTVVIKHSTPFTGGTISAYTLSVGIASNFTKYTSAFDVFQASSDTVFLISTSNNAENFTSPTSIRIQATSVGDNLDQATAGDVEVWVYMSVLP